MSFLTGHLKTALGMHSSGTPARCTYPHPNIQGLMATPSMPQNYLSVLATHLHLSAIPPAQQVADFTPETSLVPAHAVIRAYSVLAN